MSAFGVFIALVIVALIVMAFRRNDRQVRRMKDVVRQAEAPDVPAPGDEDHEPRRARPAGMSERELRAIDRNDRTIL